MRLAIIGNCQSSVLKSYINANIDYVEFIDIPAIHTIQQDSNKIKLIFRELETVDYVISQPLSKNFNELSIDSLRKHFSEKLIIIPGIYFLGYHPDLVYLKSKDAKTYKTKNFDYHELSIVYSYLKGYNIEQAIALPQIANLSSIDIKEIWDITLNNLIDKEQECDIAISDYILQNEKKILFFSFNHPSNLVMNAMSERIIKYIKPTHFYSFIHNDLFSNTIYPINESVQLHKNISSSSLYKKQNKILLKKDIIELYFKEYEMLDISILEETIEFYKKKEITNVIIAKYEDYHNEI